MSKSLKKPSASLCAVTVLLVVFVGCGGTTPNSGTTTSQTADNQGAEALQALREFYRAGLQKDGAASCSFMSRRFKAAWSESSGGQSCEAAVDELLTGFTAKAMAEQRQVIRELDPGSIRVTGDTAKATVTGESADLVKEGGRWLVANTHPVNARELTRFSAAQLELELKGRLNHRDGRPIQKATCPLNQPVKPGHSFDCIIEYRSRSRAEVTIEVRSWSGDYHVSPPTVLPG